MSTAEKIKISLLCCLSGNCKDCPYPELYGVFLCKTERTKDTLAYIQQLELENTKLRNANDELCRTAGKLERERDAAVAEIYTAKSCRICKHITTEPAEGPCYQCTIAGLHFEWRGPQEVTP